MCFNKYATDKSKFLVDADSVMQFYIVRNNTNT